MVTYFHEDSSSEFLNEVHLVHVFPHVVVQRNIMYVKILENIPEIHFAATPRIAP